jgi:hypothetical protein
VHARRTSVAQHRYFYSKYAAQECWKIVGHPVCHWKRAEELGRDSSSFLICRTHAVGVGVTNAGVTGRVRLITGSQRISAPPAPRRWWRDLAGSAAFLSVVAVVALWLANGGIRDAAALGQPATTLGRLTGLVGSDLLLIQVLLMARIP